MARETRNNMLRFGSRRLRGDETGVLPLDDVRYWRSARPMLPSVVWCLLRSSASVPLRAADQ